MIWLSTLPVLGDKIVHCVAILPMDIMLIFLISGLMFCWARWVTGGVVLAYSAELVLLHPAPLAPIFFMVTSELNAGFAAFVVERAGHEAWADGQALDAEQAWSAQLLLNVLPRLIAERMRADDQLIADP